MFAKKIREVSRLMHTTASDCSFELSVQFQNAGVDALQEYELSFHSVE